MTPLDDPNLDAQLSRILHQQARLAMSMTDTPSELGRFTTSNRRRKTRARVVAAVAAVLCLIAGAATAVALAGASANRATRPAHHHPTRLVQPKVTALSFGPAKRLPPNVAVTKLRGPQVLGAAAFGDIWATSGYNGEGDLPSATLYRISADGQHMLSTTTFPGLNANEGGPVRVGNAIVVADHKGAYTVFNRTGKKIATLPSTSLGAIAGDPSGGWIATKPDQVAHIDASGRRIDRTLLLPTTAIAGLALSPGQLWVLDSGLDQLDRIDVTTGRLTGRLTLPFAPGQVAYLGGAVYVATNDDYAIRRIDPTTMKITATVISAGYTYPDIAASTDNQLWAEGTGGTITQLNPATLQTERSIRVFTFLTEDIAGAVVTPDRIFVTDGDLSTLYSFPSR
jgi:hypothetical protein